MVRLPVGELVPNPWNPNRQNDAVRRALSESMTEFGFIDPVTVRRLDDGSYQIINGEHRWREAQEQGVAEVECVVIDADDDQARRLTLILNETVGEHDVVALGTVLAQLQNDGVDMETLLRGLPYSGTELTHLLSLADEQWDRFSGGGDGAGDGLPEPPNDPDTARDVVSFVLEFSASQHRSFMSKVRRAAPMLGTEDPQVIVKELVKRGFDSL